MRRKTLVNFGLTDLDGRSLSLMSMRHTSMLGWSPTAIRFPVPMAEYTRSYHLLAALLTFALLVAITINSVVTDNQFQVITGAIFAISAAFIVFVVQPGEHQMVSRLVSSVRYAMATLVGLLILAGLTITFLDRSTHWPLWIFSAASLPCMVVIVVAFSRARRRDRCPRISPWEQGIGIDAVGKSLNETTFADLEQAQNVFEKGRRACVASPST